MLYRGGCVFLHCVCVDVNGEIWSVYITATFSVWCIDLVVCSRGSVYRRYFGRELHVSFEKHAGQKNSYSVYILSLVFFSIVFFQTSVWWKEWHDFNLQEAYSHFSKWRIFIWKIAVHVLLSTWDKLFSSKASFWTGQGVGKSLSETETHGTCFPPHGWLHIALSYLLPHLLYSVNSLRMVNKQEHSRCFISYEWLLEGLKHISYQFMLPVRPYYTS